MIERLHVEPGKIRRERLCSGAIRHKADAEDTVVERDAEEGTQRRRMWKDAMIAHRRGYAEERERTLSEGR